MVDVMDKVDCFLLHMLPGSPRFFVPCLFLVTLDRVIRVRIACVIARITTGRDNIGSSSAWDGYVCS
ncbi:hypothetical protein BKA82DRAFT_994537 [Pisolithus tinctorius]|uniref:Uncharacterized protein n=1 Tax=Pisolithus tinctorius Marx 270 TaxID=870435 RepID=A0A0C3PDL6_PISTI|nr:hypothetical protein BKA82DRAFT_994537 [Pisolithus tinctorius]KIO11860.1 hypothetical protein M404DRAFT_994537 [Pisolithus tinctorius Marx 270]